MTYYVAGEILRDDGRVMRVVEKIEASCKHEAMEKFHAKDRPEAIGVWICQATEGG